MPAVAQTMSSGKSSRIPNTAIRIPIVRNICRQNWLMRFSTAALMIALSKDNDTSRMPSAISRNRALSPPWKYPSARAANVTNSEIPKMRAAAMGPS
ncbi:hypothetical protein BN973_05560 [Mycobacterium triplex]|uniref:Uncharacterized protein n=1 Tax=Mycobacterium triplex TaxID=47839 RepID=A0A024K5Q3_9MYCO|nr:hypothetical protein BN973_05560 [Mycobacterium triplex]